jgi:hypothetical protein
MSNYLKNSLHVLAAFGSLAGFAALCAQQTASSPPTSQSALSGVRSGALARDTAPLPTLPPAPQGKITLLGGIIERIDPVRDELILRTFGGGRIKVLFDERTCVYLERMRPGHRRDLHRTQRIHLDAVLDGTSVFARTIYVLTQEPSIESVGQVVSYKVSTGELIVRDLSLATTAKVQLLTSTAVRRNDRLVAPGDIQPGSLISIAVHLDGDGRATALAISVLAEAGDAVTFSGRVVNRDMRARLVVLEDPRDQKSYEIYLDPTLVQGAEGLREGANVTISTRFDGNRYVARTLTIDP